MKKIAVVISKPSGVATNGSVGAKPLHSPPLGAKPLHRPPLGVATNGSVGAKPLHCPPLGVAVALLVAGLAAAAPALAATYWTVPALMKSFFSSSQRVTFKRITLSEPAAEEVSKKLGTGAVKREWVIYVGESEGKLDGYAVVDAEKGMHEPIDFAVRFTPKGAVERVEVLVYREAYGDEIRSDRFRAQFTGKTANDAITIGKDIDMISGASISSRSMAVGVKRDALVLQAALKSGGL